MTITLENESGREFLFDYRRLAEKVICEAIEEEQFPFEAEVGLFLVDMEEIQRMNGEQRGIDRPTDVLSFPMLEYPAPGDFSRVEEQDDNFNPDTGEALLGDIVLCVEKVIAQAEEYGHSVEREFSFLILHSMLHLFGYDHMTGNEAAVMEEKQQLILNKLNITR